MRATEPDGAKPFPSSLAKWLQISASCAVLLVLFFARRPGMFLHPQLWAEDGPEFFVVTDLKGIAALAPRLPTTISSSRA